MRRAPGALGWDPGRLPRALAPAPRRPLPRLRDCLLPRHLGRGGALPRARAPSGEPCVLGVLLYEAGPNPEEAARHLQLLATFERERGGGTLTAEEVEVFQGRASHDMTFPAIAAVLGRSVSTVHAQYGRAVEKLNAIVEQVL